MEQVKCLRKATQLSLSTAVDYDENIGTLISRGEIAEGRISAFAENFHQGKILVT